MFSAVDRRPSSTVVLLHRPREGDGARRTVLGAGAQPKRRIDGVASGQGERVLCDKSCFFPARVDFVCTSYVLAENERTKEVVQRGREERPVSTEGGGKGEGPRERAYSWCGVLPSSDSFGH